MPPTLLATPHARISANPARAGVAALQAEIDQLQSRALSSKSRGGLHDPPKQKRNIKKIRRRSQQHLERAGARSRSSTGGRPEHVLRSAAEGGGQDAVMFAGVESVSKEASSSGASPRPPVARNGVRTTPSPCRSPPRYPLKNPHKSPQSSSLPPSQPQQQRRRRSSQVSKGPRTSEASIDLQRGANTGGDNAASKPITVGDSDVAAKDVGPDASIRGANSQAPPPRRTRKAQRPDEREDTSVVIGRSPKSDRRSKNNGPKQQPGRGRGTPTQSRRRVSDDGQRRYQRRSSTDERRRASAPPICEGDSEDEDLDTSLSSGGRPTPRRRVSFHAVEIREYETILGDHPCVGSAPPLSIGWKFQSYGQVELDQYEIHSGVYNKPPPKPGLTSREEREHILMRKLGYTQHDVAQAIRDVNKEKMRRRTTYQNLSYMAYEETIESIMRGLRKLPYLLFGKSDDAVSRAIEAAKAAKLSHGGDVGSSAPRATAGLRIGAYKGMLHHCTVIKV